MYISGWGNNLVVKSNVIYPRNINEIKKIIVDHKYKGILVRGMGRSYGDAALNENIISLKNFEKKLKFDEKNGYLECSSNLTIAEINNLIVSKGWFLNITPGSKFVSVGGAIANDVHGKNHHLDGSFSDYVDEIEILNDNSEIIVCSKNKNPDLFKATCGGMGLTGIILYAKVKLLKIYSKNINVEIIKTNNLKETIQKLQELKNYKYLVAWTDLLNKNKFGKSIIFCGNHSKDGNLKYKHPRSYKITKFIGYFIMNVACIKLFNFFYFFLHSNKKKIKKDINNFFYPLDKIYNWNEFYGKKGFTQIQILIREDKNYYDVLIKILNFFIKKKMYSYLTTLKEYGSANENYLSFGEKGLSITMDIPIKENFSNIYNEFEAQFSKENIKIYLAKDSFMSKEFFEKTYKNLNIFADIKKKFNSHSTFRSKLSERLGL